MPTIDILAAKSWAFYKTNNIMKKEIIKRLTYTFIISLVISMIYSLKKYEATIGNEARQGMFLLVIIAFILSVINFILSLTALLNVYPTIRQNFWKSLMTFILLPSILFIFMLTLFLSEHSDNETIMDFLSLGHTSILFIVLLSFHFFRFHKTIKIADT